MSPEEAISFLVCEHLDEAGGRVCEDSEAQPSRFTKKVIITYRRYERGCWP